MSSSYLFSNLSVALYSCTSLSQVCPLNPRLVHPTVNLTSLFGWLTGISKLWVSKLKFLFPPPHNQAPPTVYPLLENVNSVLPVAQAKSLESSLILLFLSHLESIPSANLCFYLQTISTPHQLTSQPSQYHLFPWSMEESLNLAFWDPFPPPCLFLSILNTT